MYCSVPKALSEQKGFRFRIFTFAHSGRSYTYTLNGNATFNEPSLNDSGSDSFKGYPTRWSATRNSRDGDAAPDLLCVASSASPHSPHTRGGAASSNPASAPEPDTLAAPPIGDRRKYTAGSTT